MRKSFHVTEQNQQKQVFNIFNTKYIEFFLGTIILIILILGNILVYFKQDTLMKIDVRNQPPHLQFLQKILYKPPELNIQYQEKNNQQMSLFDNWFNVDEGNLFELIHVPIGMEIDKEKKKLIWRPNKNQKGKTIIKLKIHPGKEKKAVINSRPHFTAIIGDLYHFNIKYRLVKTNEKDINTIIEFPITVSEKIHPLGTDGMGRDVISCILFGTKWTIIPGLIVIFVSISLGTTFGGYAGYYGGIKNQFLSLITNLFAIFPSLLIIFLTAAIFNFNIYLIMIAVGLITFPRVAVGVKNKVLSLKKRQFIEAAQELGLSDSEILWKDIIWYNSRNLMITNITHSFIFAILIEVTLSYLQLGVQGKSNSWGNLLQHGKDQLYYGEYWLVLIPVIAVLISITGFYLLGDGINKLFFIKKEH